MTPAQFLGLVLALTAFAAAWQLILRQRHVTRLRRLAEQWNMHYSATDRFRLAPRVAQRLPVPGAAAVRVVDLLYGVEKDNYRYLFATEYTVGVLRTKLGLRRVATFSESRDPAKHMTATLADEELVFAPESLPLIEQYRHLHEATHSAKSPS
jgi:hypothetical protein